MIIRENLNLTESPLFRPANITEFDLHPNVRELWKLRDYSNVLCVNPPTFKRSDSFKVTEISTRGGAMTRYRDMYFKSKEEAEAWLEDHPEYSSYNIQKPHSSTSLSAGIVKVPLDDGSKVWINLFALPMDPENPEFEREYGGRHWRGYEASPEARNIRDPNPYYWGVDAAREYWEMLRNKYPGQFDIVYPD